MAKRIIPLFLAVVLILSLFPARVLAAEEAVRYEVGDTLEVAGLSAPTVEIPENTRWEQQGEAVQKPAQEPSCDKTPHAHGENGGCELQCALQEHTHAVNCGESCTLHVHTQDCCKASHIHGTGCNCEKEEHTHDASCSLDCSKEIHAHSDDCCTAEHMHSETCVPDCGEEGHTHITNGCGGEGICTAAEHTHGDSSNCTLACALEEHDHIDSCYTMISYTTWKLAKKPALLTSAGSTEVYLFAKNGMQSFMTNMHQDASGSEMIFCFGTPTNHTELSFTDLTASGGVTLQDKGNKSIQVNATGIGEVCYTTGGVTYAFPIHNIMDDQAGDGNAFTVMYNSKAISVGIGDIMDDDMVFFGGFGDSHQQGTDRDFSKKLYLVAIEDIDSHTKSAASQDFFDLISDMRLSVIHCEDASGNPAVSPICTLSSAVRETAAGLSLWNASVNAEKGNCFFAKIAMSFTLQGKRYTTHCDVFNPDTMANATNSTSDPEQIIVDSTSLDSSVTITNEANQIQVTVSDTAGNAEILSEKKPTLTVPCSFTAAQVLFGSTVVAEPSLVSDGVVTFPVESPGTYVIEPVEIYTVTFHTNGGTAVTEQTVPMDGKIAQPTAPTKAGYALEGWYSDESLTPTSRWNFETSTVTGNTTLYANWVEGILITFDSKGGSDVASQTILPGGKITPPETNPAKSGYSFLRWCSDSALQTEWNFDTAVSTATTLYAKWTDIKTGSAITSGAGKWNPVVSTTTLDIAANNQGDPDEPIKLQLTIRDLISVPETELDAIEAIALGRELDCLDLKLECSTNNGDFVDIGDKNNILLKITLDFDPTGKSNIAVFRYHDNKAEVLSAGTQGERFELDQTKKELTICANRFSTYAIGYTTGTDTLDPYQFSKGHNSSWAKDSTRNLVFVCNGPFDLLEKMIINGQDIGLSYAESCDEGTQITLKPAFLKNLARGKYYLELHYKNGGYAIAAFTVTRSSGIPNTGDLFNMVLWVSLLGISTVGIFTLMILKKRKK